MCNKISLFYASSFNTNHFIAVFCDLNSHCRYLFEIAVNCCILRNCYPAQNLHTAINMDFDSYHYNHYNVIRYTENRDLYLNKDNYVLCCICHHVNIFNLFLLFQFQQLMKLMKVSIIPKYIII